MRFYIVDVFAIRKYTGNQLAVFRDASSLADEEMQQIAKEMNYSETTFIVSEKDFEVRIFTPEKEVPFAGHPTLGTAYVIMEEILGGEVSEVVLKLKVSEIPVRTEDGVLWMRQKPPKFGKTFSARTLSKVLGIDESEIDGRYPIQEVSTGLPFIIVPVKNLDSLGRIRINREEYFKLVETTDAKAILTFCPETRGDNHLSVRVFAEYYGVPEDPATGSANGCLAGYLARYRYFGSEEIDIRVEQGYEVGRPSLLFLRAKGSVVEVGGRVVMVARGEFV